MARHIRIPATRVLIAMLVLIVPICIFGLVAVTEANRAAEDTIGAHFRTIAEATSSEVAAFIHDRVMDVGALAHDARFIEAAEAANRRYQGQSDEQTAHAIQKIEAGWNTPAAEPLVKSILQSPASDVARRHQEFDRRYLRITITDARGATVAGTHKTLDYYQADEDFWQKIHAGGRGGVNVTDVLYDDVTKAYYVGIGVPIVEDRSNRFIGAVDALVDVSVILAVTQRMRIGPTARLLLVKADGTVIAGPGAFQPLKTKSGEYAAVVESQGPARQSSGYLIARDGASPQMIGFASTGLKQDYGSVDWYAISAQNADEALAAVQPVIRMLVLMSVLGLMAVTLFGVWVYFHQRWEYDHLGPVAQPMPVR